jgi:ribose transport system permease protein
MNRENNKKLQHLNSRSASFAHSEPLFLVYGVFIIMFIIIIAINRSFLSVISITNLVVFSMPLIFAAMAQTVIVLTKGIDLSVGPAMSLTMVTAASLMRDSTVNILTVILLCIAIGVVLGLINGGLVVEARLPPIIVTLANSSVLTGIALFIMPQPGGYIPSKIGEIVTGHIGFIPISAIILIAILCFFWSPIRYSRTGQSWYAVGGNEAGAYFSGINVKKAKFTAFIVGGIFSAIGGLFLAFQTLTGDPMMGAPYTLNSVAATVLGGTSLAGGRGGVLGSIGGALVLTIIIDILYYLGVSAYYQYIFSGVIVILALALGLLSDVVRSRRTVSKGEEI